MLTDVSKTAERLETMSNVTLGGFFYPSWKRPACLVILKSCYTAKQSV